MNMEDWNRINQATSAPKARDRAISTAETRTRINDLKSSFTKTISNNIASTNSTMTIPEMVSDKAKKRTTKQDENMDDLLNKMGLAVQRKGGY